MHVSVNMYRIKKKGKRSQPFWKTPSLAKLDFSKELDKKVCEQTLSWLAKAGPESFKKFGKNLKSFISLSFKSCISFKSLSFNS